MNVNANQGTTMSAVIFAFKKNLLALQHQKKLGFKTAMTGAERFMPNPSEFFPAFAKNKQIYLMRKIKSNLTVRMSAGAI